MGGKTLDQFNARQKSKAEKGTRTGTKPKREQINSQVGAEAPYTLGAHTEKLSLDDLGG